MKFIICVVFIFLTACGGGTYDIPSPGIPFSTCIPKEVYQDWIEQGRIKPLPVPSSAIKGWQEWHAPWIVLTVPLEQTVGPLLPSGPFYEPGISPAYLCANS